MVGFFSKSLSASCSGIHTHTLLHNNHFLCLGYIVMMGKEKATQQPATHNYKKKKSNHENNNFSATLLFKFIRHSISSFPETPALLAKKEYGLDIKGKSS